MGAKRGGWIKSRTENENTHLWHQIERVNIHPLSKETAWNRRHHSFIMKNQLCNCKPCSKYNLRPICLPQDTAAYHRVYMQNTSANSIASVVNSLLQTDRIHGISVLVKWRTRVKRKLRIDKIDKMYFNQEFFNSSIQDQKPEAKITNISRQEINEEPPSGNYSKPSK